MSLSFVIVAARRSAAFELGELTRSVTLPLCCPNAVFMLTTKRQGKRRRIEGQTSAANMRSAFLTELLRSRQNLNAPNQRSASDCDQLHQIRAVRRVPLMAMSARTLSKPFSVFIESSNHISKQVAGLTGHRQRCNLQGFRIFQCEISERCCGVEVAVESPLHSIKRLT